MSANNLATQGAVTAVLSQRLYTVPSNSAVLSAAYQYVGRMLQNQILYLMNTNCHKGGIKAQEWQWPETYGVDKGTTNLLMPEHNSAEPYLLLIQVAVWKRLYRLDG